MTSKWKDFDQNRIYTEHHNGFIIIKPKNITKKIVPFICPVCNFFMRNEDDVSYYYKYDCCSSCSIHWAEKHKHKWVAGWRPKKQEIEKYISFRKSIRENK